MVNTPTDQWSKFSVHVSKIKPHVDENALKANKTLGILRKYRSGIDITNMNPHQFFQDMKDTDMIGVPNFDTETIYYLHKDHELANTTLSWDAAIIDKSCITVSWFKTIKLIWQESPTLYVLVWKTSIYASILEKDWLPRKSRY